MATERFGPPTPTAAARVRAATADDLDRYTAKLLTATGWRDLLRK